MEARQHQVLPVPPEIIRLHLWAVVLLPLRRRRQRHPRRILRRPHRGRRCQVEGPEILAPTGIGRGGGGEDVSVVQADTEHEVVVVAGPELAAATVPGAHIARVISTSQNLPELLQSTPTHADSGAPDIEHHRWHHVLVEELPAPQIVHIVAVQPGLVDHAGEVLRRKDGVRIQTTKPAGMKMIQIITIHTAGRVQQHVQNLVRRARLQLKAVRFRAQSTGVRPLQRAISSDPGKLMHEVHHRHTSIVGRHLIVRGRIERSRPTARQIGLHQDVH
mmetsp:Transcript_24556/g.62503  ORF Transcript_24556/g.62503 Transcript_24556/m.62503 type:complete len:275 (+) Transcript_24556:198-1022(+)